MGRLGLNFERLKENDADCECGPPLVRENEGEDEFLSRKKHLRQYESSKKMYLLFFISTTVVTCFCVFVVIPQLIDYFTSPSVLNIKSSVYALQKQSVIDLLDTERSRRNQERLEIMQKFDALQQNYKLLQIEYQKATEIFLKKLHSAYQSEEKLESSSQYIEEESVNNSTERSEMEIFNLGDEMMNTREDKSERPLSKEKSPSESVLKMSV